MADDKDLDLPEFSGGEADQKAPVPAPHTSNLAETLADDDEKTAVDLEPVFDVPVNVSAVLGKVQLDVHSLLKLKAGSVVELDRKVGPLGGQACHRRLFGCHHAGDQRLAGQFEGTGGCVQGLARMTQDGRIHAAGAGGAGRLAQLAPQRLVRHLEAVTEFLANPAEHAQLGHRVGGYGGLGGFDHGGERRQETAPLRKS